MSTITSDNDTTTEARIAKALAHPLRARILQRLGERIASPGDLAVELDAPLGVVSYHVRMLRQYECVELVRTEPRRGALQHFYRAIARPNLDEDSRTLPAALRGELAGATMDAVLADLGAAANAGALTEPAVVVTRTQLELDERGRTKLNRLLDRTLEQALAIAAESQARIEAGNDPVRTTLALHLVAPDGQTAAAQVTDQLEKAADGRDETTPANFDPLMGCFWAIGSAVMGALGRSGFYLLGGPDAPEDPIDFGQYANGQATRNRLALLGQALTWPRGCGLCYLNIAHELTCTEARCTLPKVDGYDYWLDRAADDAKAKAIELGLVKA